MNGHIHGSRTDLGGAAVQRGRRCIALLVMGESEKTLPKSIFKGPHPHWRG